MRHAYNECLDHCDKALQGDGSHQDFRLEKSGYFLFSQNSYRHNSHRKTDPMPHCKGSWWRMIQANSFLPFYKCSIANSHRIEVIVMMPSKSDHAKGL